LTIDGVPARELTIPLRDDGLRHEVRLFLPATEVSVPGSDGAGKVQERSAAPQ
jgi:hypothetical protein